MHPEGSSVWLPSLIRSYWVHTGTRSNTSVLAGNGRRVRILAPTLGAIGMSAKLAIVAFLRNTFTFSGRASRAEYWWPVVAYFAMIMALGALASGLGLSDENLAILINIPVLVLIVPFISAAVRRLHDLDRPGGHLFFFLVPLVGPFLIFVWLVSRGDSDFNRYGPPRA